MTEENYNYRTSPVFLRNQFEGTGFLKIPTIPKPKLSQEDLQDLLLIGFDKARADDMIHQSRMVHFFLYDYKFERVWKNPDVDLSRLLNYKAVLSPDFSMYLEMAPIVQLYNTFRNRWCGAYWASKGLTVIPSVNWGDSSTFDFCFDGIEHGSSVAVSTYMASEHDNRKDQKEWFLAGYKELLRRIEPEYIICYNTPFPEMEGNIIPVDYDLSSWRYMQPQKVLPEDLSTYQIGGQAQKSCDTMDRYKIDTVIKGGGGAVGGAWRPHPDKPEDERLLGEPGEIKITYNKNGEKIETKIGADGRAVRERHWTVHSNPKYHTNPHDHEINWESPRYGIPNFIKPHINYDGAIPEFKTFGGTLMSNIVQTNSFEADRFKTISEFKECLIRGAEIEFEWDNVSYVTFPLEEGYLIATANSDEDTIYDTPDMLLEYIVGNDRLRNVITKVTVWSRTI